MQRTDARTWRPTRCHICSTRGAIVDVSDKVDDWDVITPEMLESAPVEIHDGDILILHTGFHRYYEGQPQQDLVRYFCMHPGGQKKIGRLDA